MALVTLSSGFANLILVWAVSKHRDQVGGTWFIGVASLMTAICFAYGGALFVFDPLWLRELLEMVVMLCTLWLGVAWLAFALVYTGRQYVLRTVPAAAITGFFGIITLVALTNGYHELIWMGFELDPVAGAATVTYDLTLMFYVLFAIGVILLSIAQLLLLDTLLSYGRLFQSQVAALLLTPIFPVVGIVAYFFSLGPVPQYSFLPLLLVPHMLLDIYALFSAGMFEFKPATRRIGERTAIDDLDTPVLTVDTEGRLINFNTTAAALFGERARGLVGRNLSELLSTEIDLGNREQDIELLIDGERRQYRITSSPFENVAGTPLGYTTVLQDITDLRQRQQRFAVINRVLRHNLRNDLTVIGGHAELIAGRDTDPSVTDSAETIVDESAALVALAERARELNRTIDGTVADGEPTKLRALVDDLVDERADSVWSPEVDISEGLSVRTDSDVLALVLGNLLDNAIEHIEDPSVRISAIPVRDDGDSIRIEITDTGPGIPEAELDALQNGSEDALQHGSGIGLWVVQSGITALGGDLSFSTENGTTVTLRIPGAVRDDLPR
nr:histidine kinase N-terminal 7TM domain-containing protein [Natranaeroarchaeum aerophilus]